MTTAFTELPTKLNYWCFPQFLGIVFSSQTTSTTKRGCAANSAATWRRRSGATWLRRSPITLEVDPRMQSSLLLASTKISWTTSNTSFWLINSHLKNELKTVWISHVLLKKTSQIVKYCKKRWEITHPPPPGTFSLSHCWWCCPAVANLQIGGHAHGRGAPHDPPCLVAPHRRKPPRQRPRVGNVSRPPAVAHGPKIWRNTILRISWAEKVRMAWLITSSPKNKKHQASKDFR